MIITIIARAGAEGTLKSKGTSHGEPRECRALLHLKAAVRLPAEKPWASRKDSSISCYNNIILCRTFAGLGEMI